MKKYLYSIVIASLIIMSATVVKASNEVYYINGHGIEITEQEYNNLLGLGFTEKDIENMVQQEFEANKNIEGAAVLSEASKYYKYTTITRNGRKTKTVSEITKEEAIRQSQNQPTRGPVGEYYDGVSAIAIIEVRSKIVGISNTYMRYKVEAQWLSMPLDRYYDIIGIGIEPTKVKIASVLMYRENWLTTGDDLDYIDTGYPKSETTGGSAQIQLPSGGIQTLYSYLYFNVRKQDNVGTITELEACGDYAHTTSSVNPQTIYYNYNMYLSGIDIDYPYDLTYDDLTPACAHFVGTW